MPITAEEIITHSSYQKAQKIQTNWYEEPIQFASVWFNIRLWQKQQEIKYAVRDYPRVAVKSCNTSGKSYTVAEIVLWWLMCRYPSKVITTAPTFTQVEDIIWKEIHGLYNKSIQPIGADLLKTELKFNSEWFAMGISTNEVNRFQGFHSPHLLVIIDEALGVNNEIWEAIEGLHPEKILAIGNPLSSEGEFFKCFTGEKRNWHTITISAQECVDWQKANGSIPGLVTQQWIDERLEDWGAKSPLYQARVLGEFPSEGTDTLIPMKFVDEARKRDSDEEEDATRIVASDIATKHGDNFSVIMYRIGHTIKEIDMFQNLPAPMTAQKIQHKYEMTHSDTICIDSDGFGEGVADIIQAKRIGVLEFHGGYASKAMDKVRFRNLRSQFYWVVAKKFEKGLYSLKEIPQHIYDKLKSQLCSIKVKPPDGQGRIQIETKDDMKERGLVSPDLADAMVYSEYAHWQGKMGEIRSYKAWG